MSESDKHSEQGVVRVELEGGPQVRCVTDLSLSKGAQCMVDVDGTLDYGHVMCTEDGIDPSGLPNRILHRATLKEQTRASENTLRSKMAMDTCKKFAEELKLQIRFIQVRYSFKRTILYVTYTVEERIEIREFVDKLVNELKTRVELAQIGVRDEAGMIGGMGPCGRTMCCCSWINEFHSINVKMAKNQGISLNPNAISGMCGRLRCCLRYEDEQYREMGRSLPREGSRVCCCEGDGRVIGRDLLRQRLKVRLEDGRISTCDVCDVRNGGGKR